MKLRVVVVGLGYVGLPLAVRASESGHEVVGVDSDEVRVRALQSGRSYVGDIPNERLESARGRGFTAVTNAQSLRSWDVAIIAVPTPLLNGEPDMSFVTLACVALAQTLSPGGCIILESTTYPGTTRGLVARVVSEESGLSESDFLGGFSPERSDPGNTKYSLENTPKVVSGLSSEALSRVDSFYQSLGLQTVRALTCEAAELAKLVENSFRQVNIALVNEVLVAARAMGINPWEAFRLAATKPFGFMGFLPGPGVGGHCLPIDPIYLSWAARQFGDSQIRLIEAADAANREMPKYTTARAIALLEQGRASERPRKVMLLGVAYKRNTDDYRESPTFQVLKELESEGIQVTLCDPIVAELNRPVEGYSVARWSPDLCKSFHLVVVMVLHDVVPIEELILSSALILDTRNFLDGFEFDGETL